MKTKLIIFDFDGTLGDTRRNIVTTMQMTIAELKLPTRSEDECASTIGLPLAGCFKALYPDLKDEKMQCCAATYRRIFDENLKAIIPQPFPHVVETLFALKDKGYMLTIASSRSKASLVGLVRDMGISDCFSLLIGANDVENAKPNPEPVLKTIDMLNQLSSKGLIDERQALEQGDIPHFKVGQALVVGDMAVDILMGANAGAKTCGVTWGNGSREELQHVGADYLIDNMNELLEIVS
ncbi:MAG: HAD family hydrolase [Prevotella sp.]|nr:HAD family hydrolase [Prevotella sp.]